MQPKLINGKTLMMSSVGLKHRKQAKFKFISSDIKDFYPKITKELLSKCLSFAETKVQITEDNKKIIYHSRKLLLFDKGNTWMKKGGRIYLM